jgi:hypothetical protein
MPVVYAVLCHRSPRYVAGLVGVLRHPDHHVILHADAKAPPALHALLAELAGRFSNVHVLPSALCSWGGWSLVEATLRAIDRAICLPGWRHFALLSEQHVPLQPPATIAENLPEGVSFSDAVALPDMAPATRADLLYRFASRWRELPGVGMFAQTTEAVSKARSQALRLGSQWLVLARNACERLHAVRDDTALWAPFRASLVADETALMSVLRGTPAGHGLDIRPSCQTFVAWPHLGGDAESCFTDALVRRARARGHLFIRKRPNHLPPFARKMLAAMPGERLAMAFADAPPLADPRARALGLMLGNMLRGRFPDLSVGGEPAGTGPACCLRFRIAALSPALTVVLLSQDFATFKLLLAWRRPFDGGLAPIRLGAYAATVLGARLPGLLAAREVHLPELPDFGFVRVGDSGAPELAARIAPALAIGRRLSALVGSA